MKLALLTLDLVPYGGQRVALELARQLAVSHEVLVVTTTGPAEALPKGVKHVRIERRGHGPLAYLRIARRFGHLLDQEGVQGVISFMTTANLVALVGRFFSDRRIPVVVTEHSLTSVSLPAGERRPGLFKALMRWTYPRATAVVGVSEATTEDLAKMLACEMSQRTIYNPVNTAEILRLAEGAPGHAWLSRREPGVEVIIAVGSLKHAKGVDVLLDAMTRLPSNVR